MSPATAQAVVFVLIILGLRYLIGRARLPIAAQPTAYVRRGSRRDK